MYRKKKQSSTFKEINQRKIFMNIFILLQSLKKILL